MKLRITTGPVQRSSQTNHKEKQQNFLPSYYVRIFFLILFMNGITLHKAFYIIKTIHILLHMKYLQRLVQRCIDLFPLLYTFVNPPHLTPHTKSSSNRMLYKPKSIFFSSIYTQNTQFSTASYVRTTRASQI